MYEKYRLTGSIPFVGAGLMLCWVPVATACMAAVYAVAQYYCPWIYLCALITLAYAYGTGWLTAWLAKRGHVRNVAFTSLVALLSALFGYYIIWGTHLLLLSGPPDGSVTSAYRPDYIWDWMQIGFDRGFWAINKGGNVSGWFLVAIWVIEFGVLVVGPVMISATDIGDSIYCETCQHWLSYQILSKTGPVELSGQLEADLQQGNIATLQSAVSVPADGPHLRVSLAHCAGCEELAVLKVERVTFEKNKKGEVEVKTQNVVEHALIAPDDADILKTEVMVAEEVPPTMDPATS